MPDDSNPQLELIVNGVEPDRISVELQEEVARRCKSRLEAINETYKYSGYTNQAYICGPLGWSQGNFSKILGGSKSLPQEDYHKFQRVCGNLILLRYDALHAEHEIRPLVTDAEARVRELEEQLADRDRAIKYLGEMLRGSK